MRSYLLLLALLCAGPSWAGRGGIARVPLITAPTTPQLTRVHAILGAAQASPTAMAVLDRAALLRKERPIAVSFKDTGRDLGYFDYNRGDLVMSRRYFGKGDPRRAVPTLVHEILHVAQHEARTPAEALERELEAHALTIRILDELGLKDDNPFTEAARAYLTASPAEFRDWMRLQHHLKYEHRPRARAEILSELEYDYEEAQDRLGRLEEALNKTPSSRELRRRYDEAESRAFGIAEDMDRLSPAGWRRYKRWSAKVWAVLRAEHARLNGR